jgi:hypothetical protein
MQQKEYIRNNKDKIAAAARARYQKKREEALRLGLITPRAAVSQEQKDMTAKARRERKREAARVRRCAIMATEAGREAARAKARIKRTHRLARDPDYNKRRYAKMTDEERERRRAATKAWRLRNPDQCAEATKRWRAENHERNAQKQLSRSKKWYADNRAVACKYQRDYYREQASQRNMLSLVEAAASITSG